MNIPIDKNFFILYIINRMNKIYNEFNSDIIRDEYRTVSPVSELGFNTPNNYIIFKLNEAEAY